MNLENQNRSRGLFRSISLGTLTGLLLLGSVSAFADGSFEKYTCDIRTNRQYLATGDGFTQFYYETQARLLMHYDNSNLKRNNIGQIIVRQARVLWERNFFTEVGKLDQTDESVRLSTAILRQAMQDQQSANDQCYKQLNRLRAHDSKSDSVN